MPKIVLERSYILISVCVGVNTTAFSFVGDKITLVLISVCKDKSSFSCPLVRYPVSYKITAAAEDISAFPVLFVVLEPALVDVAALVNHDPSSVESFIDPLPFIACSIFELFSLVLSLPVRRVDEIEVAKLFSPEPGLFCKLLKKVRSDKWHVFILRGLYVAVFVCRAHMVVIVVYYHISVAIIDVAAIVNNFVMCSSRRFDHISGNNLKINNRYKLSFINTLLK